MTISIEELTLGAHISAWGRENIPLGNGIIEGFRINGKVEGTFPAGFGEGDMVNVSLNAGVPHPKITSATLYLTSVTLLPAT